MRVEGGRRVQSTTIKGVGFDQVGRRTLIVYLVGLVLGILADKALNLAVVCLEGRRRRSKVDDERSKVGDTAPTRNGGARSRLHSNWAPDLAATDHLLFCFLTLSNDDANGRRQNCSDRFLVHAQYPG
ncbi:hypothetical protein U1Q18_017757 [Sarracenia purpurea var. burkii]